MEAGWRVPERSEHAGRVCYGNKGFKAVSQTNVEKPAEILGIALALEVLRQDQSNGDQFQPVML